jgi:surface antigen
MSLFKNTLPQSGDVPREDTQPIQVPQPAAPPPAEQTSSAPYMPPFVPTDGGTPPPGMFVPPPSVPPGTDLIVSPLVTRQLGQLSNVNQNAQPQGGSPSMHGLASGSLREPTLIRGSGKKSTGMLPPRRKQARLVVHLGIAALLIFVVLGTLMAVTPLTGEGHGGFTLFQSSSGMATAQGSNAGTIAQQAATATAVTQDGFDPGANTGQYVGIAPAPLVSSGGLNRFFYGQCTYWANMRYHALTGVWVSWIGNADQWVSGAISSGWVVSGTPRVPSIIVLQPFVQGAGYYGHVAVVEKINPDGSVLTSNWNWAGSWGATTDVTFTPGSGVTFIWAPGH